MSEGSAVERSRTAEDWPGVGISAIESMRPSPASIARAVPGPVVASPPIVRTALWFLILSLFARVISRQVVADLDMFHQMALFQAAVELGWLPREDIFAFTPTISPSVHHEWGAGALLYAMVVASGWGEAGVWILRYALLAILAMTAYRGALRRGGDSTTLFLCAPLAIVLLASGLSTLRAQMYTFLFTAILLGILQRDREGERRWIVPWLLLYVVWLNLHGGFVVGLGLFVVHLAVRFAEQWRGTLYGAGTERGGSATFVARLEALHPAFAATRHLFLVLLAMLVLIGANPYGLDYIPFLWEALALDRPLIDEWAPLWSDRASWITKVAFASSLLYPLYAVMRNGTRALPGLALISVAALAAVSAQRIVPIYAIVWFICVPGLLAPGIVAPAAGPLLRRFRLAIVVGCAGCGTVLTASAAQARPWVLRIPNAQIEASSLYYPVGAVEYLADTDFAGDVMTEFNWGAYVSWMLHPAVRVGMDSRYEAAYPPELVPEIHDFYMGRPGWEDVLERYGADAVIVRESRPLARLLERTEDSADTHSWVRVYRDDAFAIWVDPSRAPFLPQVDRRGETIEGRMIREP